jgi:hypothetical protein
MPAEEGSPADRAVEGALSAVASHEEEQLKALDKCLELIDSQLPPHAGDGQPDKGAAEHRWRWTLRRLRALQHYERVGTVKAVCGG